MIVNDGTLDARWFVIHSGLTMRSMVQRLSVAASVNLALSGEDFWSHG
ncbi:hypothetical protein [Thiomonas sp. FB-Cd]|nr:hypothetical protein [Thiomonas sp. FB-Cd]